MYRQRSSDWLSGTLASDKSAIKSVADVLIFDELAEKLSVETFTLEFQRETYYGLHYLLRTHDGATFECVVAERGYFNTPFWKLRLYLRTIAKPGIPDEVLYRTTLTY